MEHRLLSTERAKAVTRGINERCRNLRPFAELLVDGSVCPSSFRYAEMLHPEHIPDADGPTEGRHQRGHHRTEVAKLCCVGGC